MADYEQNFGGAASFHAPFDESVSEVQKCRDCGRDVELTSQSYYRCKKCDKKHQKGLKQFEQKYVQKVVESSDEEMGF